MSRHSHRLVWGATGLALTAFGCGSASGRDLFTSEGQVATAEIAGAGGGAAAANLLPDGAAGAAVTGASGADGTGGAAAFGGAPQGGSRGDGAAGGAASGGASPGAGGLGGPDGAGGSDGPGGADAGPPCKKTRFYLDDDGDGFGDAAHAVEACVMPPRHVTDRTDCYDGNADAHPGQTMSFEIDRGDGSFDYDCDGTGTPDYATVGHCGTFPFCSGSPGWKTSAAACGQAATWLLTCTGLTTICGQTTETRYQTCR